MRCQLTLSPEALATNLALAREWAPAGARVRAMVKADAYGHGLEELISVFAEHADELGVATLDEGLQARSWLGGDMPVFVMSGDKDWDDPDAFRALRQARLVPAISSIDELRLLLDRDPGPSPLPIELKLDTGMGRLGIQERDLEALLSVLGVSTRVRVAGILTHLAAADEPDLASALAQEACFRRLLAILPEALVQGAAIHSCNSGALMQRSLGHTDLGAGTQVVRPGVMLYGAAPSAHLQATSAGARLRQVGRLVARVIEVRVLKTGQAVGYGGTWKVESERPATVAVLGAGYADGCRRSLGNRARVLIRGGSFPIIGRVSMDLISVLVDDHIRVGDEAVLLGDQQGELGSDTIPAWEWASLCGTIPYEIWTGLGSRVARVLET